MEINDAGVQVERQYIGARYVPIFFEGPDGSTEWVAGVPYEPLTIVTFLNNSYTSKKPVPASAENPSVATEYWANSGNYNAQIEEYRKAVAAVEKEVEEQATAITANTTNITTLFNNNDAQTKYQNKYVIFISDSYGVPSRYPNGTWADYAANLMKLPSNRYEIHAQGGSGFFQDSSGITFSTLLNNASPPDNVVVTDIVVGGGLNDGVGYTSDESLRTAINNFMGIAKTKFPYAKVWIGFIGWRLDGETYMDGTVSALKVYAECVRYNALWIRNSCNPMRNIYNFSTDNIHPNDSGQKQIGYVIACSLLGCSTVMLSTYTAQYVSSVLRNEEFSVRLHTQSPVITLINLSNNTWWDYATSKTWWFKERKFFGILSFSYTTSGVSPKYALGVLSGYHNKIQLSLLPTGEVNVSITGINNIYFNLNEMKFNIFNY